MKEDLRLLGHIRDAIGQIESYVAPGKAAFLQDRMMQDAVLRNFEIIGEAVKGLSQELLDRHNEIPVKRVMGMRDFLIHVYFGVKLETVWQTIENDIEPLKEAVLSEQAGSS